MRHTGSEFIFSNPFEQTYRRKVMVILISVAPPWALTVLGLWFCTHRAALEQKVIDSSKISLPEQRLISCITASVQPITQYLPQEQKSYRLSPNEIFCVHCIVIFFNIIITGKVSQWPSLRNDCFISVLVLISKFLRMWCWLELNVLYRETGFHKQVWFIILTR